MTGWTKDPDAVLDYIFDWSEWLNVDDEISSATISITPTGHTKDIEVKQETALPTRHIIWLSGGRLNNKYNITSKIVTKDGREQEMSVTLTIQNN